MKRKDFWKGFGVALALVVVLNLARNYMASPSL